MTISKYYATSEDGAIGNTGLDWDTVHGAACGNVIDKTSATLGSAILVGASSGLLISYGIARAFFPFPTGGIPDNASIVSARIKIYGVNNATTYVTAQNGIQGPVLGTCDFSGFSGGAYGSVNWATGTYNVIPIDSNYFSNINKTGTTYICCREKPHDFDNRAPRGGQSFLNGAAFSEQKGVTQDPYLEVEYTIPTVAAHIPRMGATVGLPHII